MPTVDIPYFHGPVLKQRFALHLNEALGTARINAEQSQWLQRLLDAPAHDTATPVPRVDRLVCDTGLELGAELTGAWVISDPLSAQAPLFLHTVLWGLERFASRADLTASLTQRFLAGHAAELELEHVQGDLFACRARMILEHQAGQLDRLRRQLDTLPSLQAVIGRKLQEEIDSRVHPGIDVFHHPLQVVSKADHEGLHTVGTQTLVDAALADPVDSIGLDRQFLGASGQLLDETQALPWRSAVAAAGLDLHGHFEGMLEQYWSGVCANGMTVRAFVSQVLADGYRHALLQAQSSQQLTVLELRRLRDTRASQAWQVSLMFKGVGMIKLAGLFLLEPLAPELPGIYLFSSRYGVRRFANRQQLQAHFSSGEGFAEIVHFISLNEQAALHASDIEQLRLDLIEVPLFTRQLESIIALQKRNLAYVLGLPVIERRRDAVRVDDALDIRHLLDHRLAGLHGTVRWSSEPISFEKRWASDRPIVDDVHLPVLDPATLWSADSWSEQLHTLDLFVTRQSQFYDGIAGCMRDALNGFLAVLGDGVLDARDLWIQSPEHGSTRLVALALERFSGHAPATLPANAHVLSGRGEHGAHVMPHLPVELLEQILERVCEDFQAHYERHFRDFLSRPLRWLDTLVKLPMLGSQVRACALYLELFMERRVDELPAQALMLFQQVLERPIPYLRTGLGDQRVEVSRLELMFAPGQPAVALHDTLVLHTVSQPAPLVLWALCDGLSAHASLQALQDAMAKSFDLPVVRATWMSQLSKADRQRLQLHLDTLQGPLQFRAVLQPLQGHCLQALQQADIDRQCQSAADSLRQAIVWKLPADTLRELQRDSESSLGNRPLIDRIGINLQTMLTNAMLPQWIRQATLTQLVELRTIAQRWYIACHSQKDFLFGIPQPREYAHQTLKARLLDDFPGHALSPDDILVTLTHYTAAPVAIGQIPQGIPAITTHLNASLTDYAIERFSASQDGMISVTASNSEGLPDTLTVEYLERLIRELDISTQYRQLLKDRLSPDDADYVTRLKYYAEQVPPFELLRLYGMRISGQLSEQGYRFIEGVMNMPDGIGRLPVLKRDIIISPMQLQAAPGLVPDQVLGAFIIAPRAPQSGPWILYALFGANFLLKEYPDEAGLLADIRTNQALQAFVLARLGTPARRLYDNGGFLEPHVPFSTESDLDVPWETPGPVTLVISPVQGNSLQAMFQSAVQMLEFWFEQLSVTNREMDQAGTKFLLTLGGEQILSLLPGRLGALVGVWQGPDLLHDSALDVVQEHWGKAASELLAGLGVLISVRSNWIEQLPESEPEAENTEVMPVTTEGPSAIDFQSFGWGNNQMTPQLWARLRPFQVHEVALNTLVKDPLLNLYLNPHNGKTYVPLAGAVYEVVRDPGGWTIVNQDTLGPRVTLGMEQRWSVYLQGGLRGGGGVLTRMRESLIEAQVEHSIVVEARGMAQIRQRYRNRAQNIVDAHAQARQYLETCLDNLSHRTAEGNHHPQVTALISDFFGAPQPDARLIGAVDRVVRRLYGEVIDSSLSTFNSERYIVGTRRSSGEDTLAFTFVNEPQKRIYLTEKFFIEPMCRLKLQALQHGSFHLGRHYRSAILLHELSHLYCGTEDIAYTESHMPFIDLIEDNSAYRRRVKEDIVMHQNNLSHRTPPDRLFRLLDNNGTWQELSGREGDARRKVLAITGAKNLAQARTAFYDNVETRTDLMLANADTVTLLITVLGREKRVP